MKSGSGFLLVFVGLLLLWLAITGRLDCLTVFANCVTGGKAAGTSGAVPSASGTGGFTLPSIPSIGGTTF